MSWCWRERVRAHTVSKTRIIISIYSKWTCTSPPSLKSFVISRIGSWRFFLTSRKNLLTARFVIVRGLPNIGMFSIFPVEINFFQIDLKVDSDIFNDLWILQFLCPSHFKSTTRCLISWLTSFDFTSHLWKHRLIKIADDNNYTSLGQVIGHLTSIREITQNT